jgi:phosphatidylglycerol lysyltransferase
LRGEDRVRALALLREHGRDATSFQTVKSGFSYWFDDDAFVAFAKCGDVLVTTGAPIAAPDRVAEVAKRFVAHAEKNGNAVCFFGVEKDFVEALSYPHSLIGLQPVWDPSEWETTLASAPSLREQLRRARAKKVKARLVDTPEIETGKLHDAIHRLAKTWLDLRGMAPMGFVVHIEPFTELAEKNIFVAEREGILLGMVALAPLYARGFLVEDLFRDPNAPNGTTEALIDAAMKHAAKNGSRYVTLGLAPLAGDVSRPLRAFREHASILFDFRGLEAFKRRLRPARWDAMFIAHTPSVSPTRAVVAVLRAFARGSFLRFGIETLMRGPPVAVWTLAILLVPWTFGLASFDAEKWFPSLYVQAAWVVFDVGLAIAMLSLAKRWRASLAFALAIVVTIDAITTLVEALVFNVSRIKTPLDAFLVAIACLAPAAASVVVWGSWRRRHQP